jgi:DNA-binding XRE family transcriptional regulator
VVAHLVEWWPMEGIVGWELRSRRYDVDYSPWTSCAACGEHGAVPPRTHPFLKIVGTRVRQYREARGWSQERLAAEAALDRTYISGIERGIRNMSVLALLRIARVLRVTLVDLVQEPRR